MKHCGKSLSHYSNIWKKNLVYQLNHSVRLSICIVLSALRISINYRMYSFVIFAIRVILFEYVFRLPEWTKKVFVAGGDFEWASGFGFKIRTATTEMARVRFRFLIREILDRFSAKINSTLSPNRTIWIYSGHDATLVGILDTLQLFLGEYFSLL